MTIKRINPLRPGGLKPAPNVPVTVPVPPSATIAAPSPPRAEVAGKAGKAGEPDAIAENHAVITTFAPDLPADLSAIASAAYEAVRSVTTGRTDQQARTRAIAAGLVDVLLDEASIASRNAVPTVTDVAAARVWSDIREMLTECDLSLHRYCSRSGRLLGTVSPDHWHDYLIAIARMGETRAGEDATRRLLDAIIIDKAHTVAPAVLTTTGANLAMIRQVSPPDYIAVSCAKLFPAARSISSLDLAQRAEKLGQARAAIAALPAAAQHYACEIITLYLANIDPVRLPIADQLLSHYRGDFSAPWQSVATVGHFCGRLVQQLAREISKLRQRPLDQITRADLRALRIHWIGNREYQAAKAERAAYKRAMLQGISLQGLANLSRSDRASIARVDQLDSLGSGSGSMFSDFAQSMFDALDMQAALAATGHPVRLSAVSATEAQAARDLIKRYRGHSGDTTAPDTDDSPDDPFGGVLLDLSDMLASGEIPQDLLPEIDSEEDLITMGLLSVSDILDFSMGDDDEDDEDLDADDTLLPDDDASLAAQIKAAMGHATAKPAKPSKPTMRTMRPAKPSHIDTLTAQALSIALELETSPAPAPIPARPAGIRIIKR